MEELGKILVDGKVLQVERGIPLLPALRNYGFKIPSLCYHPTLGGGGSCGLCVIEVFADGIWRPQHACLMQAEEGLQIRTVSPRIKVLRAWAAGLLWERRPFPRKEVEELLQSLVQEGRPSGQSSPEFAIPGPVRKGRNQAAVTGCILCGLCIRICGKIGKNRLVFLGRGQQLRIGLVADDREREGCGNCRACDHICPTGFITPDARRAFTASLYE